MSTIENPKSVPIESMLTSESSSRTAAKRAINIPDTMVPNTGVFVFVLIFEKMLGSNPSVERAYSKRGVPIRVTNEQHSSPIIALPPTTYLI